MTVKTEIDWKILDALLQFKVTLRHCADYMGVSIDAIQRRVKEEKGISFSEYHELKLQRTATKLQQKAIEMALSGDRTMLIFCLKNLAGWADKVETTHDVNDETKKQFKLAYAIKANDAEAK